ncbi:hypothetical protein [Corynebacterium sp. sy039]|uniref:hypothetical protein n=1 Tax=Corynebacterium sp. sy039 TaxID=2599641 RepID=UPI0011B7948A|nr:hypothetical protein [Corynebacterium sp. sy039]QDZ42051.1 hypothetical protein FQV43_01835 [Corynebacterium sp. sy039]
MHKRLPGILLIMAVFIIWIGQFITMLLWQGIYMPEYFLMGDLGARTCVEIAGPGVPRYICSPGHRIFTTALSIGGVVIISAALLLIRGQKTKNVVTVVRPLLVYAGLGALIVAGFGALGIAFIDSSTHSFAHTTAMSIFIFSLWGCLVSLCIHALRYRHHRSRMLSSHESVDTAYENLITPIIAWCGIVLLVISLVGFGLFISSTSPAPYGTYQHMSCDSLLLWLLMFGAALGFGSTKNRQLRRQAQRDKDAAIVAAQEALTQSSSAGNGKMNNE